MIRDPIHQLIDDEGAVSPVIGVILMVAITVILAAVIGTFVLGLGGQVSQTAPQASISTQEVGTAGGGGQAAADYFVFKHGGSDAISFAKTTIKVSVGGSPVGSFDAGNGIENPKFTTADTLRITDEYDTADATNQQVVAILNGDTPSSGTQAYAGMEDSSGTAVNALGLGSGDSYTITFIDQPSGQVVAEKTGTA